tara:strand:- start:464 stop:934 length:471 start_codon:yes stop_codon:yes gene_type:complete
MAKPVITTSDNLVTLVTKHNQIVEDVGDISALNTSVDSDIVGAINSINAIAIDLIDSSDVRGLITGGSGIQYISASGTINAQIDSARLTAGDFAINSGIVEIKDSSVAKSHMEYHSIDSNALSDSCLRSYHFQSTIDLIIYDSSGSVLKTIYSPGR